MPHIHTAPGQFDQTVSFYIIRTDFDEPKVLFHHHLKQKRWMQFGGHIELNETPWQTLCHEIPEETGYTMSQLKILQPKDRLKSVSNGTGLHPIPVAYLTFKYPNVETGDHFHTDTSFVFVTDQDPANSVAKGESAKLRLFTLKELVTLQNSHDEAKEVTEFIINSCLPNWEALPTSNFN